MVYVAAVHIKDWDKGNKEGKGRFRKFLSIFIPSYESQKKVLTGLLIVFVVLAGISAMAYFEDNNKWENFEGMLKRDRKVKSKYVYEDSPDTDLASYDDDVNKLFPDLYDEEVVRLKDVGGRVEPFRSSSGSEDEVHLNPGDRVHVDWEVLDEYVCDTPVRAYCGIGGGGVIHIGMVDKSETIEISRAGTFVMRAFCYVKDDVLDYYTLITPRIDLSDTDTSVYR